jgi:hypothetical protein
MVLSYLVFLPLYFGGYFIGRRLSSGSSPRWI